MTPSHAPNLAAQDGLSPLTRATQQPLMLGLFLPLQSGAWTPTTAPRGTDWTFDYNAKLMVRADELGFDLAFGLAQWRGVDGYGGKTQYRKYALDPLLSTCAAATLTQNLILISTVHVLYGWHPLHLAKFGATADHISRGRWGLNLVTGYQPQERAMFGLGRIEHDQRYDMAAEFTDMMDTLWREEANVDWEGAYWSMQQAYVSPKPMYGRPILVNAASSDAGLRYAAKYSAGIRSARSSRLLPRSTPVRMPRRSTPFSGRGRREIRRLGRDTSAMNGCSAAISTSWVRQNKWSSNSSS